VKIYTDSGDCLSWLDNRKDYKEVREITIGEIHKNIVIVVVHTDRFGYISIISDEKSNSYILDYRLTS
jgi:uncharacterized DUF497 family protein